MRIVIGCHHPSPTTSTRFTDESPFPGGPGETWSADDFRSLTNDLEARVFGELSDETWFYPGHGDDSALGAERPHLGEWREHGW